MSLDIIKESVYSTKSIDNQSTQIQLQEDVIVPDIKPDINKVLNVDTKMVFEETSVEVDRVRFAGKVEYNILYLADGSDKPVHSLSAVIPVEDFINVEGMKRDITPQIDAYVENVRVELLNSRKVNVSCILEVDVKAEEKFERQIIVGASGDEDIQIMKKQLSTRQLILSKDEKFIIKDEVALPDTKANIRDILWCDIKIKNKDVKLLEDKVAIKGELNVCTLYSGEDDKPLEYVENNLPFNGVVECRGCNSDMYCDSDVKVAKQYIQIRPDLDGEERVLELEIITRINVNVYSMEQKEIVEDIYSPTKKITVAKNKTAFENMVFKNQMQSTVNQTVSIPQNLPRIMQIIYSTAVPKIEGIQTIDDKVIAEAIAFVKVLYIAADDENPLCSFEEVIPFKQVIEARGAKNNHTVQIKPEVEYVNCNMLSDDEVDIKCTITLDTTVLEDRELDIITDIQEEDMDIEEYNSMPSITVYVVDSGDTLWKIAKQYNTTVEEIMEINDLESELIVPGQKLIIIKKPLEM